MTVDNTRFEQRYALGSDAAFLEAEMDTLGTDYQSNGYTTRAQADEIRNDLGLAPGQLLLDLGSGCGFPGLYLAKRSGCSVVSVDPVAEGGRVAAERSASDGLSERSLVIRADGESLPIRSSSVDAVVHADVMC